MKNMAQVCVYDGKGCFAFVGSLVTLEAPLSRSLVVVLLRTCKLGGVHGNTKVLIVLNRFSNF
jgi:hypothetical protein